MNEPTSPDQIFIRKLTDIVLANIENEKFGVNELAKASDISLYRLGRRLHLIYGKTVNQFIRETRLQKALEILQDTEYSVSEVAYRAGFGSPAYFNHCFHRFFGYPPGETKKNLTNTLETATKKKPGTERITKLPWTAYILSFHGILVLTLSIGMSGLFIYNIIYKSNLTDELVSADGRVSIAVMPFQNMTHDTIWNVWQEGIQQTIISSLSNSSELKVIQKQNIETSLQSRGVLDYTTINPIPAGTIARSLNANIFISGSIKQAGSRIRMDAQLTATKSSEVLHSFEVNGLNKDESILDLTDTLRKKITDFLLVSKLIKENPWLKLSLPLSTYSPEALRYAIYGSRAYKKADWVTARNWFFRALAADSSYIDPMSGIYYTYRNQGMTEQSLFWVLKLYAMRARMPIKDQLYYRWIYSENFEQPDSCIKYLKQLQEIDDQSSYNYLIGAVYVRFEKYDKAILAFKNHLEYSRKRGKFYLKDNWVYPALGEVYHTTGQYKKEKMLYRQAERINDDQSSEFFSWVIRDRAALAITEGDTVTATRYIQKLISFMKDNSSSDAAIASALAWIYWRGDKQDKAEEYFRKALLLEPENPARMNTLANRLIDRNKNFDEFLALIDNALDLSRNEWNYYDYMDTKGWGLYKFGKLQEALEIFQNLWDTIPFKMYYYKAHLEEVKRAITSSKKLS